MPFLTDRSFWQFWQAVTRALQADLAWGCLGKRIFARLAFAIVFAFRRKCPCSQRIDNSRTCDLFDSLKAGTSVLGVSGGCNACALQSPKSPLSFRFSFQGCENIEIRAPGLEVQPYDVQSSPTGETLVHPTSRMFMQHHKM